MRSMSTIHALLGTVLIITVSPCLSAETNAHGGETSKYLDAVRTFADNVLKYGRDTYGPKHTPLFVDGLNIHTHEPVKWIAPRKDGSPSADSRQWILSNIASQQNLFRLLDGLTKVTGDQKYKQAAMDAIEYAFGNLQSSNGLLYWGIGTAYDAQGDKIIPEERRQHMLKANLPHYELMWQVDPEATKRLIESFWSAHIRDWQNLDMDRIGSYKDVLEKPWKHEYEEGPVFLPSGSGTSFSNAGTDLLYAAAMLTKLSGDKEPLLWAKRIAYRYVRTRHPKTGISYYMYKKPESTIRDSDDSVARKVKGEMKDSQLIESFPWPGQINPLFRQNPTGQTTPTPGFVLNSPVTYWQAQFLVGAMLAEEGSQFRQWALEEFTAFGKASYRKQDNVYLPILTDGTNLEGYVVREDSQLLGPSGGILEPAPVSPSDLWAYSMGYRVTKDAFMLEMARNIAKGNRFGDIGATPKAESRLNHDVNCPNPYALLAFLELHRATGKNDFLHMAERIGDCVLAGRFHRGFFVASEEHVYTKFDAIDSLALLRLHSALAADTFELPEAWPSKAHFACPYRWQEYGVDNKILYTRTESSEPPLSLEEAVAIGDIGLVRSLLDKGVAVDGSQGTGKTALQRAAMNGNKELIELLLDRGSRIDVQKGWPGGTPLHWAAEKGHREIVELLVDKGADVNAKVEGYPKGDTPLHSAVRAGHKDIVELLIDRGADVNAKNSQGRSPIDVTMRGGRMEIRELLQAKIAETSIHGAASQGVLAKVKAFLENGVNIDAKDDQGMTPLHLAAQEGHKEVVGFLLSKNAEINVQNEAGDTPLHCATRPRGIGVEISQLLIDKGADVSVKNNNGKTPLDMAVGRNRPAIAKLLIEEGAAILNIHTAAFAGNLEKVRSFIEAGTNVDAKDETGMTPLLRAISSEQAEVAKFLIENGADVNTGDKWGYVPLVYALWNTDSETVRLLLDKGADANAKDSPSGYAVLHWATMMDNKELTELVLAAGADVNAKSNTGETPLDVAAYGTSPAMGELLVAKGAEISSLHAAAYVGDLTKVKAFIDEGVDINMPKGMMKATPLHSAAAGGRIEVAEFLIRKGSDLDAENGRGQTALHMAAGGGYLDVVQLLLKSGADVHAKDRGGRTPMDLAQKAEHKEVVDLLHKEMQVHDVAITKVSAAPSYTQGETVSIVVTLENRGESGESCAVKLMDATNDREIGRQSVVLLGKRQAEFDLAFDTSSGGIATTGSRVEMNGDMNGDGYKDILLSGHHWNDLRGRVFLYYGGPNLKTIPDMVFTGDNPGDRFGGYGEITIGDLNKDGFDDVIIGGLGFPAGKNDGRVYVYYGGVDMDNIPDVVFDGEAGQRSFFGLDVAASDVDQDGWVDLLIGAQNYDHGGEYRSANRELGPDNGRGRVHLYWGSDSIDITPDVILEGENRGDWFGRRISAAGDINGDGYNDILIGARAALNDNRGRAYLFWGNTRNHMDATCDWVFEGEDKNDNMGSSLCIFDIDSDGYSDVILGARYAARYAGRVYIHWGEKNFDGSKPDVVLEGEAGSHMGGDEIACGYFNADKYGDIIAGAWGKNKNSGQAYLFYGNTKRLFDADCDHTFDSEGGVGDFFGLSVSAGDVDNDNHDDILIGAPEAYNMAGRGYLYYGPFENTTDITFNWDTTNASIGKHTLKCQWAR